MEGRASNPSYCLSTAFSDLVLAATSFHCVWVLRASGESNLLRGSLWFLLIASAATLGVFRFGKRDIPDWLAWWHTFLSGVAGYVGTSLLASQYQASQYSSPELATCHLLSSLLPILAIVVGSENFKEVSSQLISTTSVLSVLVGGIYNGKWLPVYGSLLAAVASLLDRSGHILGLPCVDYLHYLLSVANIFLVQGLVSNYQ